MCVFYIYAVGVGVRQGFLHDDGPSPFRRQRTRWKLDFRLHPGQVGLKNCHFVGLKVTYNTTQSKNLSMGRRPAFFIYLLIESVFAIATAFAPNFGIWLACRIGVGFTVPAIMGTPFVMGI